MIQITNKVNPNYLHSIATTLDQDFGFESDWFLDKRGKHSVEHRGTIILSWPQVLKLAEMNGLDEGHIPWLACFIMAHEKSHAHQEARDHREGKDPDEMYEMLKPAYEMEADLLGAYLLFKRELVSIGQANLNLTDELRNAIGDFIKHDTKAGKKVSDTLSQANYGVYRGEDRIQSVLIGRARAAQDFKSWNKASSLRPAFQKYMREVHPSKLDLTCFADREKEETENATKT